MNPNEIITAELLAGLNKCPWCGVKPYHVTPEKGWAQFRCSTSLHIGVSAGDGRTYACQQHEVSTLRARVQELQAKVQRLTEAGDQMAKDFSHFWTDRQSVRDWPKAKGQQ